MGSEFHASKFSDLFSSCRRHSDGPRPSGTGIFVASGVKQHAYRILQPAIYGPGVAAHVDVGRVKDLKSREILLRIAFQFRNNAC